MLFRMRSSSWAAERRSRLRHVAIVANFLDDNKPISDLKVYLHYFKLHRSYSISFKLENVDENFLWDRIYRYVSLEKESDNFCVVFTYSITGLRN